MIADLSERHGPIGSLLSGVRREDVERYRLSDEQVRFFHENGYLKGVRILSDEQVETLRGELQGLFDPKHPGNYLFHE
ncbi:MAG TPA: hypothetical protein VMS17_10745, partial [Gemmataceae bacterium]|nr:hypothetical protein [Gemmataceae bacterium]